MNSSSCDSETDSSGPIKTMRDGTFAYFVERYAAAVVCEGDGYLVALLSDGERNFANLRFASVVPDLFRLDTVRERIANQVLKHGVKRSSTLRSSSIRPPRISRLARFFRSFAVCRSVR